VRATLTRLAAPAESVSLATMEVAEVPAGDSIPLAFALGDRVELGRDPRLILTVVLEEDDPAALAQALGTVARARSMTEIAKASGLARESLYKALRPESQPRFDTMNRVCHALGVKLVAQPLRVTEGDTDEVAP
jgi:probable addiction module antidote protein